MKKIYAVVLVLISLMLFTACGGDKWQESYDLGMRYLSEGNYAEAIIAFEKAIEIDPKQPMAYVGRADAHIASGETADNLAVAFADYTAAIGLDETNANAWLGLADVYIRQGEFDKAMETLQEALVKTNNADIIADKLAEIEAGNITDSSGKIRKELGFNWYRIWSYDENNNLIAVTSYDTKDNVTGHVDIEYDSNGKRVIDYSLLDTGEVVEVTRTYNTAGQVLTTVFANGYETRYEYDSFANMIKRESYLNGKLYDYWIYSYDENGKKIGEKHYNGDGILRASTASE